MNSNWVQNHLVSKDVFTLRLWACIRSRSGLFYQFLVRVVEPQTLNLKP